MYGVITVMRTSTTLICAFLLAVFARPGQASDRAFPGIIDTDDRQIVDSWDPPWNAVGKINTPSWRRLGECSGTLIASDIVLTAAHCLFNEVSGRPFRSEDIHFSAGQRRDQKIGHSVSRCVRFASDYRFKDRIQPKSIARDYAFIVLAEPIDTVPVGLLPPEALKAGLTVTHAGYGRDRRFLLVAHRACTISNVRGSLLHTDCDTNHGQSGGPLLVERDGGFAVAGVMSATLANVYNQAASPAADTIDLDAIRACR